MTLDDLKAKLGKDFGSVAYTQNKRNPYLATSKDGRNQAFGATKEQALQNLIDGIERRKHGGL